MLQTYQTEIIAAIAIITLSIIYFLMRSSTKVQNPKDNEEKNVLKDKDASADKQEPQVAKIAKVKPSTQKVKIDRKQDIEVEGEEEGSFGVEEEKPKNSHREKIRFKKRSVPPHAKITKQNFSEFAGLKILVAEDNLINQKVITGLLADTGIEITMANDGQEALDILQKSSDFKIILMDIHMPRVDGFEATKAIRSITEYDGIVVVALSGDTAVDDIRKMKEAGMGEHLEKPLRMDALYDILYAYSAPDEEIDNDEFVHVISTKELDGDKGLRICGGDEEFYREILNEFVSSYENSADRIQELLSSGKLKEADKLLLDVVGVTSNIGADKLTKSATEIKDALKDTQEKSYLNLIEQYRLRLVALLKDIKGYL